MRRASSLVVLSSLCAGSWALVLPVCAPASSARRAAAPTAQLAEDLAYGLGLLAVVSLVGRSVFDSVFIENDATTPDKPAFRLPNPFGGGEREDPTIEAERLRQALQDAAQAGDLERAYKLEKELKQFLWDNNVVYEVDVEPERTGLRVEDLEVSSGSSVISSENSYERDKLLKELE